MKKLIWKNISKPSDFFIGNVGKVTLFSYRSGYVLPEDKYTPYLLSWSCGLSGNKTQRYATAEECRKHAKYVLKYIREQLL